MDRDTIGEVDWAAAGKSIGNSGQILYLNVAIVEIYDHSNIRAFFGGVALNRSIQALRIVLSVKEDEYKNGCVEQVFSALLPFFQHNKNLQFFELEDEGRSYPELSFVTAPAATN
jgi:hypothetical protein